MDNNSVSSHNEESLQTSQSTHISYIPSQTCIIPPTQLETALHPEGTQTIVPTTNITPYINNDRVSSMEGYQPNSTHYNWLTQQTYNYYSGPYTFNIGGIQFQLSLNTIQKSLTLYDCMTQGKLFIDRDGDIFKIVLQYLRSGDFEYPYQNNTNSHTFSMDDIQKELEFYYLRAPYKCANCKRWFDYFSNTNISCTYHPSSLTSANNTQNLYYECCQKPIYSVGCCRSQHRCDFINKSSNNLGYNYYTQAQNTNYNSNNNEQSHHLLNKTIDWNPQDNRVPFEFTKKKNKKSHTHEKNENNKTWKVTPNGTNNFPLAYETSVAEHTNNETVNVSTDGSLLALTHKLKSKKNFVKSNKSTEDKLNTQWRQEPTNTNDSPTVNNQNDLRKTKMCQDFKDGKCTRSSNNCNFAHSLQELRSKNFFKTEMCAFHMSGHCVAGSFCRHAHNESELTTRDRKPRSPKIKLVPFGAGDKPIPISTTPPIFNRKITIENNSS